MTSLMKSKGRLSGPTTPTHNKAHIIYAFASITTPLNISTSTGIILAGMQGPITRKKAEKSPGT
jgi:hypothetical protein